MDTPLLSWRQYDEQFQLSDVLTNAARSCANAKAANPSEYLAAYFAEVTRGDGIETLSCEPVFVANGAMGLSARVRLFSKTDTSIRCYPFRLPHLPAPCPPSQMLTPSSASQSHRPATSSATSTAVNSNHGTAGGARGDRVAYAAQHRSLFRGVLSYLTQDTLPLLLRTGVYAQPQWDDVLVRASVNLPLPEAAAEAAAAAAVSEADAAARSPTAVPLPANLRLALSALPAIAAATNQSIPLYQHLRQLLRHSTSAGTSAHTDVALSAAPPEKYAPPQLLLPFFGRDVDGLSTKPSGTVSFHTLYLLPAAAVRPVPSTEEEGAAAFTADTPLAAAASPVSPSALASKTALREAVTEKLLAAYMAFQDRYPTARVRHDGAFVMETAVNLTDAVEMASDVLRSVGLTPGEEVCFGVRIACPVVHAPPEGGGAGGRGAGNASGTTSGGGGGGGGKGKKQTAAAAAAAAAAASPQKEEMALFYSAFNGDPDVTGAQLAEYIRQQVLSCKGQLIYLEDVHDTEDVANLHRMQSIVAPWATVGGRSWYTSVPEEAVAARVKEGLKQSWAAASALDVSLTGTLSELLQLCAGVTSTGRAVTLTRSHTDGSTCPLIDIAFGFGAAYVDIGGLSLNEACLSLSRYMSVQDTLQASRGLAPKAAPPSVESFHLLPVSTDPVPEIKRKGDGKKKKPGKH